ncbi:SSI family serine proteinase inhibitor [Aquipuribacter sp. MA13-6]
MRTRRGRTPTGPRAAIGLLVATALLAGCGQAGTDGAGPTTGAAAAPAQTTEDPMNPDDSPTGPDTTPEATEPELLLPPSPPVGAAELPVDPVGAELTVVVGGPDGDQPPVTLSCDWATGTATGSHPQAQQACADLLAAVTAGNPFAPVAPDAMCTQQYGGDATAEITGAVLDAEGGPVDVAATFALTDGCQISRWQAMGAVLGPFGGAA